jgi:hypothetical protein
VRLAHDKALEHSAAVQILGGHAGNPESVYQLPSSFLQSMFIGEWKWDFIGEREIASHVFEDMKQYAEPAE